MEFKDIPDDVKKVKLPNGQMAHFPESMANEEISRILKEKFGNQEQTKSSPSFSQSIKSAMGINEQKNPLDLLRDLAYGAAKGTAKGAEAITQGGQELVNPLLDSLKIPKQTPYTYSDMKKYIEPLKSNKPEDWQNRMAQGVGSYIPYGLAGGASLPGQMAAGAAHGAINAEPGQENLMLPQGKTGSAIESALMNALFHGAGKVANSLRPSVMFRGNMPPEELARNLAITKGTETGLGDVIGSPFLKKRLENTLTMTPFSGANESLQRTGQEVVKRGENLLSDLVGGKNVENAPEQIYDSLIKQFEKHKTLKNNLYDKFNKEADKQFLDLSLKNFSSKAREYKDAIESTNILKYEPALKNILGKLGIYEKPLVKIPGDKNAVNEAGQNLLGESLNTFVLPSAKEVNLLKGKLGEYAKMYGSSPDPEKRYLSKIFGDLSRSLKTDINEAVEKSGNKELKSSYEEAENNYKKNFSNFLDKDIYKYISGKGNKEEIVNSFIKTKPTADLANQITKLATTLPQSSKKLLGYSYLSPALDNEGNLNPAKLGTLIEKLKPNQLKALFPDQNVRKQLKDYNTLQHMNKEAQYLMFNPKTGQRTTDVLMTGLLSALGHIGSGNVGGALLAPGAAVVGGRAATKALTSEKLRESLVREMLRNRTKYTKRTRAAQALGQGARTEAVEENQGND